MTVSAPPRLPDGIFIDGASSPADDGATFDVLAPSTGAPLVAVAAASAVDVQRAVVSARTAFDGGAWSRATPAERGVVMMRLVELMADHAEELALLDAVDAGRPISHSRSADVPDALNTLRWYAQATDKVFGKVSPTGAEALGLAVREPVGVVGAVLPWNFPLPVLAWKLGPALATGNSVVVKPPELASLSTLRMAELAVEAGLPPGVLNVVPGLGHVAGRALGLHPDVDAVSFTGSTEVGREFLRYSADSNLKRVVLELGGKSPQVVMADVGPRLDHVAADLASAIFWGAGQNCTAGSRIIVDNTVKGELLERLTAEALQWTVGDSLDPATRLGPLIEPSAVDRVERYVDQARSEGARVVTGGHRTLRDTAGWFYEPTVIDGVTPDQAVVRDEIFGPVVVVLGFDTEAEAVRLANDTSYGLAATVWSRDIDVALRVARSVKAGTVAVNGYSEGDITTPFGGYRQSGFGGRDKGLEAMDQYTELKTIWVTLQP